MTSPLVTIAIPTYNRADGYLREALASALAQDYEPLEIVVCDNASTDATAERVAAMADQRVRYVRHENNIGGLGNFNACLNEACGKYFLLLHDDDCIDPDFVSLSMRALGQADTDREPGLLRTGTRVIDKNGAVVYQRKNGATGGTAGDLMLEWFAQVTSMYFVSTLFHTAALRDIGGFASPHGLYVDVAASIKIAARLPVFNIPDVKASFRRHGGNRGGVQAIRGWCEDSQYLIELLAEAEPWRARELRHRAQYYFTSDNYARVRRLKDWRRRWPAYWVVYQAFGFRLSPWRVAVSGWLRRWRMVRRHAVK